MFDEAKCGCLDELQRPGEATECVAEGLQGQIVS